MTFQFSYSIREITHSYTLKPAQGSKIHALRKFKFYCPLNKGVRLQRLHWTNVAPVGKQVTSTFRAYHDLSFHNCLPTSHHQQHLCLAKAPMNRAPFHSTPTAKPSQAVPYVRKISLYLFSYPYK